MFRRLLSLPIDWLMLAIVVVLVATGIITIYTISYLNRGTELTWGQIGFAVIGLIVMLTLMFWDYRSLGGLAVLLLVIGLVGLLPLLPWWAGSLPFVSKIFGAYRWLNFGFFQIQPAEIFKLVMIIVGAKFISRIDPLTFRATLVYLALVIVPVGMIILQPDLGTASVVAVIGAGLFLASGAKWRTILLLLGVLAVGFSLVAANLQPYQRGRLETFLNPAGDPQNAGYNILQAKIAIGSGGLTGQGFGQGSQTALNFLPVAHTDFIFAGFAEATGFIGSIIMIGLYVLLIWRVLGVAAIASDRFGSLLAIGIGWKLFFQAFVHLGMNIGLLPVTGIPLPFVSHGGTALIIDLALIGVLQSIYIRHHRLGLR